MASSSKSQDSLGHVPARPTLRPVLSLSGPALLALARDVLDRGVRVRFRAPGSSMSPFIRHRDVLTLAPIPVGRTPRSAADAHVGLPLATSHPGLTSDSRGAGPPACDHRPSGRWRRALARLFASNTDRATASHKPPVTQPASNRGAALAPPVSPVGVRLGDVVAFESAARLIVHRVVRTGPGQYLLKGDNVAQPDGWFPAAALLGRVVRVERSGRPIRIGLGPERALVALLSRSGVLPRLLAPLRWVVSR